MKNKELFLKALDTLFWSWGSEPSAEVIWGCNDLLEWYEAEYGVILGVRFEENCLNYESVVEVIKNN